MPKQKIEIEVDVPEGYEATDFREPRAGEFFLSPPMQMAAHTVIDFPPYDPRFILRKKWEPPKCLVGEFWIYRDYGEWYASDKPMHYWSANRARLRTLCVLTGRQFVEPPDCADGKRFVRIAE